MLNATETRAKLLRKLQEKSVFRGDFVLSSGAKSSYYIDCRLTTLDPEGAWLVGNVMLNLIQDEASRLGRSIDSVGGLTMGADPISLAVAMCSFQSNAKSPINCFVVRKAPKAHGQTKLIEGNFKKGDRVVVIDDVVTTGDSTIAAINAVQKEGGQIAFIAVFVDRQEGGCARIEQMGFRVVSAFRKEELLESSSPR